MTKVPYMPNGQYASSTDPATWSSFDQIVSSYEGGRFDGIGVVLDRPSGIIGFDFDKIELHQHQPEIKTIFRALKKSGTYIEESPSGKGLRAFVYGELPFNGRNNQTLGVEIYSAERYLTVTGHRIPDCGTGLAACQDVVDEIVATVFPPDQAPAPADVRPPAAAAATDSLPDDKLLQRANNAKNGKAFSLLMSGNWQEYYRSNGTASKSQSEADLALSSMLAFWTGKNAAQMDRLFRSSGLMRPKWDKRHGAQTYGQMTITKAITGCANIWTAQPDGSGSPEAARGETQHTFNEQNALAWMNEHFFVAPRGDKVRICEWDPDYGLREYSQEDLKLKLKNRRVLKLRGDSGADTSVELAPFWLSHPQRREYRHVGYYPPPAAVPQGAFNLWRGFGVEAIPPKTGKAIEGWDLLAAHIYHDTCNGVLKDAVYLLNFLAHCVQYPDRVGGVAVVLQGAEGTGKGVLGRTMQKLLGAHGLHLTSRKGLTGQFNDRLETASFVFADETCWAGDHEANDILKALITEPTADLEKKFGARWNAQNRMHIIIATNKEWAINAGTDARRFFVLRVGKAHMQDRLHFAAMIAQLENGGYGRLLHDLLTHDLSRFDIGQFPHTAALAVQKGQSLDPVPRWLVGRAHEGALPNDGNDWSWTSVTALYRDFCERSGRNIGGATNSAAFGRILRDCLPTGWPRMVRKRVAFPTNGQVRGYEFPDLATLQGHLIQSLGLPPDYFS